MDLDEGGRMKRKKMSDNALDQSIVQTTLAEELRIPPPPPAPVIRIRRKHTIKVGAAPHDIQKVLSGDDARETSLHHLQFVADKIHGWINSYYMK